MSTSNGTSGTRRRGGLRGSGSTVGDTARIVLDRAGAGSVPDFGALVSNPTTVAVFEAARRGELGSPDEAIAERHRDE